MTPMRTALPRRKLWRLIAAASLLVGSTGAIVWSLRSLGAGDDSLRRAARAMDEGRLNEAEDLLRGRAARDDRSAIVLLARLRSKQNRPESAVRLLENRLNDPKDSDPDGLMVLAQAYLALGRTKEAYSVFHRVVALRPNDVSALKSLAELTYRHAGLAEALEPYQRLERLEPGNPAWPRARGRIYMEIDRYEPAAEAFRLALRLAPENADLRFDLAEADFLSGRLESCLENLVLFRRARPDDRRAAIALAECLQGLGRIEEARAQLDALLAQDPTNARGLRLRAELHMRHREFSQAVALLERASAADPRDWRVLYQLSLAYDRVGRHEDARAAATRMREYQQIDGNERF